jgi:hypothetical protein
LIAFILKLVTNRNYDSNSEGKERANRIVDGLSLSTIQGARDMFTMLCLPVLATFSATAFSTYRGFNAAPVPASAKNFAAKIAVLGTVPTTLPETVPVM